MSVAVDWLRAAESELNLPLIIFFRDVPRGRAYNTD